MTKESIIVAYAAPQDVAPEVLACLSQSEIDRAEQFKMPDRRRQFVCARALLRATLEKYDGSPAQSYEFITNDKGKPFCVDGPAISIAHSNDTVVCAVTDEGNVGVDVESPDRGRNIRGIADRYFSKDEAAWLTTQPDEYFHMLWVLKEAWLKARGTGLAGGLDSLRCFVTPPDIDGKVRDGHLEALSLFAIDNALVGLATTSAPHQAVILEHWDPLGGQFDTNETARLIATSTWDLQL